MKKSLVVSALALTASIASAQAADLARRPAPVMTPVPMAYNWSGFYFGGHVGGGWTDVDGSAAFITGTGTTAANGVVGSNSQSGVLGGIQGGFNYALTPNWVIGVEGDFTWTGISNTQSATLLTAGGVAIPATSVSVARDLNWLASARGRLGYTWDRFMLYGTGGAAWADYDVTATASLANGASAGGSFSNTRSGWVAGVGVEWAIPSFWFAGDWTTRLEYLHYDFRGTSGSANFAPGPGAVVYTLGDPTVDVVRVGLNYKFGAR
jgi:outer membrane immunogenic protein